MRVSKKFWIPFLFSQLFVNKFMRALIFFLVAADPLLLLSHLH